MVQGVNPNLNNYMVQNTGMSQPNVQQALAKSTEAVSDTVESNAIVSSAMGIDKNSMLLSIPLIGLIKYINNGLMSGEEGKSLVGKIANLHSRATVTRGREKGSFLYGGSTVILLLQKDSVKIKDEFFYATAKGEETSVRMCDALGNSVKIKTTA